jgi:hypothetical protein
VTAPLLSGDRRQRRARWVHPDTHQIVKFLPSNPPHRGDTVLVDGERHRVLACPVKWDGSEWRMVGRGVKVRRCA